MEKELMMVGIILVLLAVGLSGCNDKSNSGNTGETDDSITYASFTNGEFYVEYPSDWDVTIEKQDQGPDTIFVAEAYSFGPYIYVRGTELEDLTNGFEGWADSTYQDLVDSEDSTVIDYQEAINEALIICNELKGDDVPFYTQYKFILCIDSVYLCTVTTEVAFQSDYQDILEHAIMSFECAV